ncbi:MAG: hypothetical protein ACM3SY_06735 [Candidatus Omnitrophota bacterium]
MKHLILVVAIVVGISWGIVMNAQDDPGAANGLKVTILIFSGRPNPTFMITDPVLIDQLTRTVSHLPKDGKPTPPVLGFNGILVENFSKRMPDLQSFLVKHSSIELKNKNITGGERGELRQDSNLDLQETLLEYARKEGLIDEKIIDLIKLK